MKRSFAEEMGLALPEDTFRLGVGFLEIGARTKNALRKAGIVDVEQCKLAVVMEIKIPGMAKVCSGELLDAVNALYQRIGFSWPVF